jgi:hypothetical protein
MTELIVTEQRLKALVLDSVSSPITRRVYNMALDEFMSWLRLARLHQGDCQCLASMARGSRPRFVVGHHLDVSHSQTRVRGR